MGKDAICGVFAGMLYGTVFFYAFDIDGGHGACGAQVLTSAASDALGLVYSRYPAFGEVVGIQRHHFDGFGGTMSCAIAAKHAVGHHNAVLFHPHGDAFLYGGFLLLCDSGDGSGGTNIRTDGAFGTAIAALERHLRLHEAHQVRARAEHIVGTLRHAKLASGAMRAEVFQ